MTGGTPALADLVLIAAVRRLAGEYWPGSWRAAGPGRPG